MGNQNVHRARSPPNALVFSPDDQNNGLGVAKFGWSLGIERYDGNVRARLHVVEGVSKGRYAAKNGVVGPCGSAKGRVRGAEAVLGPDNTG